MTGSDQPAQYFRAGAGAVIINRDKKLLALERADAPGAWQMPQGGLEISEEPEQAIYRELFEETCIPESGLSLLASYPDLLAYELPAEMRSAKTGRGQVQRWFLFKLKTPDAAIDLNKGAEFIDWRWLSADELLAAAVEFRKPLYEKLFGYFRLRAEPGS
jgi:putative (di)nucleoside polyphosphate hydrolase